MLQAERDDWNVSYELGDTWKNARKIKLKNSSLFKIDVLVYPQLAFKNLVITQIYQVLFDLSPAIEVSLWKGMKLTAQLKIPVYNDGYGRFEDKVHPGHITISQRFRLPYNVFGKVTVGCFSADQYGVDAEFYRPFKDERFSLMARIGYTGMGYWSGFRYVYDPSTALVTWSLGGSFYWPQFNTQFNLKAEQYLLKEKGVKFEMIRHFRYCSIGFYAMKPEHPKMNGGFRFQVALPPYKYKRKGYIPRVNTSANMGIVYNAGNERYYYRQYKADISAVFALAVVALATTLTSCEKEEFNVNVTPTNAQAVISPIVLAIEDGVTTDVTGQATIAPAELTFTGNPTLAAKSVDVTASYNGLSATVTVKVPALQAGQFATLTPTIILQEEDAETKIVAESTKLEPVTDPKVKTWDNYELYWFDIPSFPYVVKEGAKVGAKKINTTDLIERAAIESFFNTLENTYEETTVTTPENKYKVYANSRTTASITYTVVTTEYKVVKKAVTKAETEPLASIEVDDYTTSTLFVLENQDIPGHGHSHGHGHGHGEGNAGGGVGELD